MKAANVTNEPKCSKNHISRIINRRKETREHEFPTMSTCIQSPLGTSEELHLGQDSSAAFQSTFPFGPVFTVLLVEYNNKRIFFFLLEYVYIIYVD